MEDENYEDDMTKYTNQARRILMNFKSEKNDLWQRFLKEEMPHGFKYFEYFERFGENIIKIDVFDFVDVFFVFLIFVIYLSKIRVNNEYLYASNFFF